MRLVDVECNKACQKWCMVVWNSWEEEVKNWMRRHNKSMHPQQQVHHKLPLPIRITREMMRCKKHPRVVWWTQVIKMRSHHCLQSWWRKLQDSFQLGEPLLSCAKSRQDSVWYFQCPLQDRPLSLQKLISCNRLCGLMHLPSLCM